LIVKGVVSSVDELRKKGNFLIEVRYGANNEEAVQIVSEKPVKLGQQATVALEGAKMPDGKVAKRSKVAGEWSEGVLLQLGVVSVGSDSGHPAVLAAAATAPELEEDMPTAGGDDEEDAAGKVKQRKKKKG